jgi:hypothetical protein
MLNCEFRCCVYVIMDSKKGQTYDPLVDVDLELENKKLS